MLSLKIAFTGLSFITGILLARLLGPADYGIYAYAMAWILLLGVLGVLGMDSLLVRNFAAYRTQSEWGLMRGLFRRANQLVLFASLVLSLFAAGVAWVIVPRADSQMLSALLSALILLPLRGLTRLRRSAMQGLHRVVIGQMPEMLILPILFIILVGGWWYPPVS